MAAVLVVGIRLQPGLTGVYLPMTVGVALVGLLGAYLGQSWRSIERGIYDGVGRVTVAAIVLLLVGAVVGVWIQAGTIPTLVDYGLRLVSPRLFLPTSFVVCLLMSVATGTAYGTIGTVGIALIGVQAGLGIPAPIAAGAILSGAYFGDKMSPLSDTTNIAAAMGEADLFRHIRSMLYTTVPAGALTFVLFVFAGGRSEALPPDELAAMVAALESGWRVGPLHLVPIGIMLVMALRRVPTLLVLFASLVVGALWAIAFQGASLVEVAGAATGGFTAATGVPAVDRVLTRGGMTSMQAVIILVLVAGALGGALRATGVLETIVEAMLRSVRRVGSLIAAVLATCYTVNLFTGNQALSLILAGQMFAPVFRRRGVDRTVLTRSLEDAGTLSAPLVPWGVAGGVCSQLLGVPTLDYLPYVWLAYLVPVFSLLFGYTGFAVWAEAGGVDPPEG